MAAGILRRAVNEGRLRLPAKELLWLERIEAGLREMPFSESELWEEMLEEHAGVFDPSSYGWPHFDLEH